jgi:hypothetical protein
MDLNDFELIPVSSNRVKIEQLENFRDEYVYDIEVEDSSHTFTANDILVHNSLYVKMDAILKKLFPDRKPDWNNKEDFAKIKNYIDGEFQSDVNTYCADFLCKKYWTDQRLIEFKREKISEQGEYLAKKRYIVHVRDSEGHECDKFSYTGVEIKKNELPETIKNLLGECVEGLIREDWDNDRFQQEVRRIWDIYVNMDINDISYIKNLNTPKESTGFLTLVKGAGVHARAAEYYNALTKEMNITDKYEEIRTSDRFHYFYIKNNNKYGIDVIGYKDRYPKEFENIFTVDREKMFEKTCLSPLKQIIINHNFASFDPSCQIIYGESSKSLFDL